MRWRGSCSEIAATVLYGFRHMYAYKVSDKASNMENLVFSLGFPPLILQKHCKVCKSFYN